ncbi:MAG: type IV toxin-antitoxin system AbiEi family antitoxin domain-containing protein [Phycisphaerae bacterium]|nr:type IV toxin-antitoxin system AbiEi family antitoxin domain-containing protein [Phycisphaerae bacterium]
MNRYKTIQMWAEDLGGVFTIADLKVAFDENTEVTLYRRLGKLIDAGVLVKVKRGMYATHEASLTTISSRIEPGSYISTGTILAQKAIIGSVPARRVQAVKMGRPRTYECELGIVDHLSIHPRLYFGYVPVNGMYQAIPEKAFLDVCYFFYKGKKFSFDPASDINTQDLDFETIDSYLDRYDKRFVTFFNRIWRGS